jgi:dihydroorotate dehydrogenase
MDMYLFIKKFLFAIDPERAHTVAMCALKFAYQMRLIRRRSVPFMPYHVMGIAFPNRIGLAAGLDKNADYVDALSALGFGFIEIGTVTPKPQSGNPKPRLFRLIEDEAIINRMGFNSKGADYVASQLSKIHYRGVLGINIGKNKDTPLDLAVADYKIGFQKLWRYASYITINISSPNTAGLRDLQMADSLHHLLSELKHEQKCVTDMHQKYVPLVIKLSPDLSKDECAKIAAILLRNKIDGVIIANTTIDHSGLKNQRAAYETGGLSGRPLHIKNVIMINEMRVLLNNQIPIIASGGVMDVQSADEVFEAGASLIQIYTGLIYRGLNLIRDLGRVVN